MSGSIRSKYEKIKIDSDKLQQQLESSQNQIEEYKSKMEAMRQVFTEILISDSTFLIII